MTPSAYVHIPFCPHICAYCSFFKTASHTATEAWLEVVIQEAKEALEKEKELDPSFSLDTLYFGGGTPNVLSVSQLQRLSAVFVPYLSDTYEWSMECNPELVTVEQAKAMQALGINRVSLGGQSFDDRLLCRIGRHHSSDEIVQAVEIFKAQGIDNISLDLIYGLPDQSLEQVQADVEKFLELDLPHLSIYSLQIDEGSLFYKQGVENIDEDLEADMYEAICRRLKEAGYIHYEISSFCKPDRYSRHNLAYWSDVDFLGIGCGASGKERGSRYTIEPNLKAYMQKGPVKITEPDSASQADFEAIMMCLRSRFGLDYKAWNAKYHQDFVSRYASVMENYLGEYLEMDEQRIWPTEKGMEILNSILTDFLIAYEG